MTPNVSRRHFLGLSAAGVVVAGCTGKASSTSRSQSESSPATARAATGSAAAPSVSGPVTVTESALPGNRDWRVTRVGPPDAVEAFADRTDVVPGEPFTLFVSSTGTRVGVEAFRMGWYGGAQARRVWSTDAVAVRRQAKALTSPGVNMVTAPWLPSLTVDTSGWPEGAYLLRITGEHGQRYVPIVLRSVSSRGKILLIHATTTWQAYNTWGGRSLYEGPGGSADFDNRSRVVSCDRPFDGNGAVKFLFHERPMAALVDQLGLPVAYTTDQRVHTDPQLLRDATAIVSLGHDEYWTPQMRANVVAARDAGVNVAFLGANACFRRIRLQSSRLGPNREIVCYKADYEQDPMYGIHDALVTNDYRGEPAPDPECSLTGTYYEANPAHGAYVVQTPDSWLFRGTGVRRGSSFAGLIGPEYDRVNPVVPLPRPLQVLSHSPIICKDIHTYSDSAYYTVRSGAGVFNSGTMGWVPSILRSDHRVNAATARFATRVTANLLTAFQHGPAAHAYPAHDNLDALHPYVGDPTWEGHNLW